MKTHFQRVQLWVFRVACCPGSSCGTCSGCPLCSWDTTSSLAHSTQCSPGWPTMILTWVTHLSDAWKCNFLLISCQRQSTTFFFSLVRILLTCSVSQYTNAFAMAQLCGVLCAPWNGLIMDRHRGKPLKPGKSIAALTWAHLQCGRLFSYRTTSAPEGQTEEEADLHSSYLSLFLTGLQCVAFSVCASVPVLPLQYLTFALQVLNRSFLYGGNAAFISIAWVQHGYRFTSFDAIINNTKKSFQLWKPPFISAFHPTTLGSCMVWWCVYQQWSLCCSTLASLWSKGL